MASVGTVEATINDPQTAPHEASQPGLLRTDSGVTGCTWFNASRISWFSAGSLGADGIK